MAEHRVRSGIHAVWSWFGYARKSVWTWISAVWTYGMTTLNDQGLASPLDLTPTQAMGIIGAATFTGGIAYAMRNDEKQPPKGG